MRPGFLSGRAPGEGQHDTESHHHRAADPVDALQGARIAHKTGQSRTDKGINGDRHHLEQQENCAERGEALPIGVLLDELREKGREDQDGLRIAGGDKNSCRR